MPLLKLAATIVVTTVALDIVAYLVADRTIPVINVNGEQTPIIDVRQWVVVVVMAGELFFALSMAFLLLFSRMMTGESLEDRAFDFAFVQSLIIFSACILLLATVYAGGSAAARIPAGLGVDLAAYQISEEGGASSLQETAA